MASKDRDKERIRVSLGSLFSLKALERRPQLGNIEIEPRGDSRDLLVFIHGYAIVEPALRRIREVADDVLPNTDLLMPAYPATVTANSDPRWVAAKLQKLIRTTIEERSRKPDGREYERVILVGNSIGALLLRKILTYALGRHEGHPLIEEAKQDDGSWVKKVDRVVLLAGMNRGWSLQSKPKDMPLRRYLAYRFWIAVGRLPFWTALLKSVERGRPFVADLRIQWLTLARTRPELLPPVFQALGDRDDLVHMGDNTDLQATPKFTFVPVDETGHLDFLYFKEDVVGPRRRELIAMLLREDVETLHAKYRARTQALAAESHVPTSGAAKAAPQRNVVFLIHGIRTNADWCESVKSEITKIDQDAICESSSYGFFPMLPFLLFNRRKAKVRWFMDRYTEQMAQVPNATFNFVGHSNGTYLLAEGLRDYQTLRVNRAVFMGSVVPSTYNWPLYFSQGRIRGLRNDRASADFIVAVFPGFFQQLGQVLPFKWARDIGDGGFRGFDRRPAQGVVQKNYIRGGHSAALAWNENHATVARFLFDGGTGPPGDEKRVCTAPSGLVGLAGRLAALIWLGLAAALIALGFLAWSSAGWIGVALCSVFLIYLLSRV
jgi:alpha-beta hydrolase superfamily lysophospholipase